MMTTITKELAARRYPAALARIDELEAENARLRQIESIVTRHKCVNGCKWSMTEVSRAIITGDFSCMCGVKSRAALRGDGES